MRGKDVIVRAHKGMIYLFPRRLPMTLDTLLLRANRYGSAYTRDLYFRDCWLEKSVLFVPDRATGEMIGRLFGTDLRGVIPDLRIVVQAKPEPVTQRGAFKKGYTPQRMTGLD